jgi:hypothetical protein
MLETLHLLRGVSLHPIWPPAGEIEDQKSFINQSARITETFLILDEIAAQKEKALIFLESLDLQEHLALMIKTRYGLKRRLRSMVKSAERSDRLLSFNSRPNAVPST